jgi:hypothetical protein
MPNPNIARRRLYNQQISHPAFEQPEEVVRWLGAVQAQEYGPTLWSLGLRMRQANAAIVEAAVADGRILRTHLLRPTWHFVTAADIRWVLALTAPRVHALNAYMVRQLDLDERVLARSNEVIAQALAGGRHLTRKELGEALGQAGIEAQGVRLGYILHYAELEALICSGARRGKQFTYALLDERAPQAKTLDRDEALAELAKRYFTSHGPATRKDFTWWSSLTMADAKAGVEMLGSQLASETIDNQTYWFDPASPSVEPATNDADEPQVYLLPIYDEYISYADRSAIFDPRYKGLYDPQNNLSYAHMVVIDGQIVGTWKRTFKRKSVEFQRIMFRPLTQIEEEAVTTAAQRYGNFHGLPVVMVA